MPLWPESETPSRLPRMLTPSHLQLAALLQQVRALVAPIEAACAAEVARLEAQEERRQQLLALLQELQKKAANVE